MKNKILLLLVCGLILRLVLSFQFYSGDVNNHISWGKDILANGLRGIYDREFYFRYGTLTPNYPPIILFLFAGAYGLYDLLYNGAMWLNTNISFFPSKIIFLFQNINLIPAFLKLPAILADIGIAYYIYLFAQRITKNEKWSLLASSFVLFNPAFFYNSALWGQIEALPTLFVLAAFYNLLYSRNSLLSVLLLVLGLLSKQNAAIFVPIFAIMYWQKYGLSKSLRDGAIALILFWILFLPFTTGNLLTFPFEIYWSKILTNSVSDYVTYHAFNFWTLFVGFDHIHDSTKFLFDISYQLWGYILFGGVFLFTSWRLWKRNGDALLSILIISFASFLFMTRLHERHLEPTLPFLLLISIKDRKLLPLFIYASLFYVVNLYHDWWAPRVDQVVNLLSNVQVIQLLVIGLIICFLFCFLSFLKSKKSVIRTYFSRK